MFAVTLSSTNMCDLLGAARMPDAPRCRARRLAAGERLGGNIVVVVFVELNNFVSCLVNACTRLPAFPEQIVTIESRRRRVQWRPSCSPAR